MNGARILESGSEQKDIKTVMSIHSNGQIMMHFRKLIQILKIMEYNRVDIFIFLGWNS